MTPNVCFALLDAAVIGGTGRGAGACDRMTHARLLEEVAALGGVLRHLGVGVGVPVRASTSRTTSTRWWPHWPPPGSAGW